MFQSPIYINQVSSTLLPPQGQSTTEMAQANDSHSQSRRRALFLSRQPETQLLEQNQSSHEQQDDNYAAHTPVYSINNPNSSSFSAK